MKIQTDDRPVSKKRKTRPSSVSQNSEDEPSHPPPEDTPSPLPSSPLRNSPDPTPSPASPVPTTTQSTPIHKLTPLREADPIPEDASKSASPQQMEDGEELYFDLNLSYPPSPTDVPMASPPTVPVDEDVIPPPDFSQQIPPAANFDKTAQPLPEVTGVFSSLDSFFTATTHNQSKDKAGSSQNKSSSVNDQPKGSAPSTRIGENTKQMKLLKLIRKDQKKILQRFTHFQNSLVQFGLILEWVTKHLVPTIAPGDLPPELPAQPNSDVPSPSSSSDDPASSD
uniref:Sialidase-like n=1 Tax=Cicer arietinum TaxID=3827 RepID=A0A1S2Z5W2_CICAR|nr:sialidase-like [Cicer arietinum]